MKQQAISIIAGQCYYLLNEVRVISGENKLTPWNDLNKKNKTLMKAGVKFIVENPTATPEDVHNNWLADRARIGWKYGEKFSMTEKTHPAMVPYSEVDESNKPKDLIFIGAVKRFAATYRK